MANNTITQGATPEKEWFTLQEVAERWGFTEKDVMKLALTEKLKISYLYIRLHKKPVMIDIRVPSLVALERTKTLWLEDSTGKQTHVNREDLLIARAEVERIEQTPHIGQPAPSDTKPPIIEESAKPAQDAWIARARALYRELKRENPRLNQNQLAKKIEPQLLSEGYSGRGKKPFTAENIARRALQNM